MSPQAGTVLSQPGNESNEKPMKAMTKARTVKKNCFQVSAE